MARCQNVKYYSNHDLSIPFQWKKAEHFLGNFDAEHEYTINETLSLYNCTKFIENKLWLRDFSEEKIKRYKQAYKPIQAYLSQFFHKLDENNVEALLQGADFEFAKDVADLIIKYKVADRIETSILLKAMRLDEGRMHEVLRSEEFVNKFAAELKERLLNDSRYYECIISSLICGSGKNEHYLPALTNSEKESVINTYLDGKHPSLNYVATIAKSARLASDKTRLKAQKVYDKITEDLLAKTEDVINFEICAVIHKEQTEPIIENYNGLNVKTIISQKFLDSLTNNAAIIQFLAYGLGISFNNSQLSLPSFKSEDSTIMRILTKSLDEGAYDDTEIFWHKLDILRVSITACVDYLEKHGRSIESALEWFLNRHLKNKYGVENFRYTASTSTTYLEKTRHMFSEMDSIIKQFACLVEHESIIPEIVAICSNTPRFCNIPSLMMEKYFYLNEKNEGARRAMFLLCSDQSGMNYTVGNLCTSTFLELINEHTIKYGDFSEWQRQQIDWLAENGVLVRNGEKLSGTIAMTVLTQLNEREAAIFHTCKPDEQILMKEWKEKNWLTSSSTLLSQVESDFYDFMLGNRFSNAFCLRNRYIHGATVYESEEKHKDNYVIALILILGLVIKIEFELKLKNAN